MSRKRMWGRARGASSLLGFAMAAGLVAAPAGADIINVPDPPNGIFTIQDGINAAMPGDEVVVGDGVYLGVSNRELILDKVITLRSANGADDCAIDCEDLGRAMTVTADATIRGFTMTRGFTDGPPGGGAMFIELADPTIEDCVFLENVAVNNVDGSGFGGAIWCDDADILLTGCQFLGNRVITPEDTNGGIGGAIMFTDGSDVVLTGCVFDGNSAEGGAGIFGNAIGGAFYVAASSLDPPRSPSNVTVDQCIFDNNTGVISAGAIFVDGTAGGLPPSTLTMTDSHFDGNSAGNGGALTVFGGAIANVDGSTFTNNSTAPANEIGGGAVSAGFFNSATFTDCLFADNDSASVGGAVSGVAGSSHTLIDCQFTGNTALTSGGAVHNSAFFGIPSTMSLQGCDFNGNSTPGLGGAAFNDAGCTLTATACVFDDNTAESPGAGGVQPALGNGGAIACNGTGVLDGCTFSENRAIANGDILSGSGGAVLMGSGADLLVTGCDFDGNEALSAGVIGNGFGGAISTDLLNAGPATLDVQDSTFTSNHAGIAGGAIFLFGGHTATIEAGSVFQDNSAQSGGAIAYQTGMSLTVRESEFLANFTVAEITFLFPGAEQIGGGAIGGGGGDSTLTVEESTFFGNMSLAGRGGAVSAFGSGLATLTNCEFRENAAALEGGAIVNHEAPALSALGPTAPSTMELTNCLLACNISDLQGGGVANLEGSTLTSTNCTLAHNEAFDGGGGGLVNAGQFQPVDGEGEPMGDPIVSTTSVINSILWANDGVLKKKTDDIDDPVDGVTVSWSVIKKWRGAGGNNIKKKPKFVDAGKHSCPTGNYRLSHKSRAIDAGNDAAVSVMIDLDGNARIVGEHVDMGAYEFQGTAASR